MVRLERGARPRIILTDAWEGLDAFFSPDEEILIVRTREVSPEQRELIMAVAAEAHRQSQRRRQDGE